MSLPNFKLLRPRTVQEATGYLARYAGAIQILAGGTDLLPSMRQRLFAPEYLMDISGIEELKKIRVAEIGRASCRERVKIRLGGLEVDNVIQNKLSRILYI